MTQKEQLSMNICKTIIRDFRPVNIADDLQIIKQTLKVFYYKTRLPFTFFLVLMFSLTFSLSITHLD